LDEFVWLEGMRDVQALRMTSEEREARWRSNYAHISVHTASMWADHFITELNETCSGALKRNTVQAEQLSIDDAASAFAQSKRRLVVIGYNAVLTRSGARHGHGGRDMTAPQLNRAKCVFCAD
jgi:trehalose 6-phosphate synthase/phosphatase